MLIDICIKFREYSLSGFQVIERTRFVTDRQTDRRTDRQTDRQTDPRGKTICLPTLKGGDIMKTKSLFIFLFVDTLISMVFNANHKTFRKNTCLKLRFRLRYGPAYDISVLIPYAELYPLNTYADNLSRSRYTADANFVNSCIQQVIKAQTNLCMCAVSPET